MNNDRYGGGGVFDVLSLVLLAVGSLLGAALGALSGRRRKTRMRLLRPSLR
jgi:hypothetical protein